MQPNNQLPAKVREYMQDETRQKDLTKKGWLAWGEGSNIAASA